MAKNKVGYTVPASERKEFDLLVQRANRRILSNMKYIQQEDIKSQTAQRALVGDYMDKGEWAGSTAVFSRSKSFTSESAYKAFVRHIEQWGASGDKGEFARSRDTLREGYEKAIIKALTTAAIDNGNGVLTKQGRLPANLAKEIRSLSLEQLTNFFDHADPTEDLEVQRFSSYDYLGVDRGEFVDITRARLNALKQLYPDKAPKSNATKPKKKKKRKSSRKKKK